MRCYHASDDRCHQPGAEIHLSENTVTVARRVSTTRLECVALYRVDGIPCGVHDVDGSGGSGREYSVIDGDLIGGAVTQMETESGLVWRSGSVNKYQVAVGLAIEDEITG